MYLDALAATAVRNFSYANSMMSRYLKQLSTGLRINSAADDPAGLAISEHMRSQVAGLHQAVRNAQDTISLIQVAEGAMGEIGSVLQRMRELSVQALNGTYNSSDRDAMQKEFAALVETIRGFALNTEFNTMPLLDGTFTDKAFQIGANAGQTLTFSIASMKPEDLGLAGLALSDPSAARAALDGVDAAIDAVSGERASLGAMQNRLDYTISGLEVTAENLQAAESRIRDADITEAMMQFVKWQLQSQLSAWVLSQINVQRALILQLLLD